MPLVQFFPKATLYCVVFFYLGGYVAHACSSSFTAACSILDGASFFSASCGNLCVVNSGCQPPAYVGYDQNHSTTSSCPANSSGTVTCTCTDPYVPDSTGTSCVPVSTCTIPPLTKLTDLVAIDFDNNPGNRWRPDGLTAAYQVHVSCVEDQTRARGGTPIGTSAYRPEQYQRHLFEIVQKDGELHRRYMTAL